VKSSPSLPSTSTLSILIEKIVDAIDEYIEMSDVVNEELEEVIQFEILHRIDEITVFAFLDDTDLKSIARHIVDQTVKRFQKERNIDIGIGPLLLKKCVYDRSFNTVTFGARPMRRAEQRSFEGTVIDIIIRGFDFVTVELNESSGMVRVKGLVMWKVF